MTKQYSNDNFVFDKTTLAILESLPFGVYYCDVNLVIHYMNQPYADHLGIQPGDALGRKVTDVLPSTRAPIVIKSGTAELYNECSVLRGRENQRILVNRIPLRNDRREIIGFISQLISVGKEGWNTLWDKIEQAEHALQRIQAPLKEPAEVASDSHLIVGESPQILRCIELAKFLAETNEPVLITGATGVGKELFANWLHRCSPRMHGPLICINCASISRDFVASELFGYAPGAFTGAMRGGKAGLIELATGGTLFLDEIGDLPLDSQGALLRVLETRQVQRLNATKGKHADFRLVSATNRDLLGMLNEGLFREDLYYRINALQLHIPRLQERDGDIPVLVQHFKARFGKPELFVDNDVLALLEQYPWPGNVRELRNAMTYAAVQSRYGHIRPLHLPPAILAATGKPQADNRVPPPEFHTQNSLRTEQQTSPPCFSPITDSSPDAPKIPVPRSLAEHECHAVTTALRESNGNVTKAAKLLSVSRTTLYKKIVSFGLNRHDF